MAVKKTSKNKLKHEESEEDEDSLDEDEEGEDYIEDSDSVVNSEELFSDLDEE